MIPFETLTIENTTYCSANCIMCPREQITFKKGNMSQEIFEKAFFKYKNFSGKREG